MQDLRRRAVFHHPGWHRCQCTVRLPDDERHRPAISLATGNNHRFTAARTKAVANDRHGAALLAGSMKLFRPASANAGLPVPLAARPAAIAAAWSITASRTCSRRWPSHAATAAMPACSRPSPSLTCSSSMTVFSRPFPHQSAAICSKSSKIAMAAVPPLSTASYRSSTGTRPSPVRRAPGPPVATLRWRRRQMRRGSCGVRGAALAGSFV